MTYNKRDFFFNLKKRKRKISNKTCFDVSVVRVSLRHFYMFLSFRLSQKQYKNFKNF